MSLVGIRPRDLEAFVARIATCAMAGLRLDGGELTERDLETAAFTASCTAA
jgi:hypothetical protein